MKTNPISSNTDDGQRMLTVPNTQLELSYPAALRAFQALSPFGQAMLMAMIRWVSMCGDSGPTLGDAALDAGLIDHEGRIGVHELIDCGLLRRTADGTMVLHPLFSVIGHRLRREAAHMPSGPVGSCEVATLFTQEARA